MSKTTFCIIPFIHLEARSDSFVAPCCMSQAFYKKDDGKTFFSLSKDTLSEVWESNAVKDLRNALLAGEKPAACSVCWKEEAYGAESKRLRENRRWSKEVDSKATVEQPVIKFLDLKLGSTCNLKCRICSPSSSSQWVKEFKDVNGVDLITKISNAIGPDVDRRMVMQWPEYNERFWEDMDQLLSTVQMFEIYGGEPFLIKRHFELLRKSIALGYSKNQVVHYNTNGTIYPQDAVDNIWPHFKEVEVMLSIDGIGEQFEYQRYPAVWDEVEANMFKFLADPNLRVQVCLTVSSFNVYYLPEYLAYFKERNIKVWLNMLYQMPYQCIQNLPVPIKEAVITKLTPLLGQHEQIESILEFLKGTGDDYYNTFTLKLAIHDKYRGQDYKEVFPEFAELLTNHLDNIP